MVAAFSVSESLKLNQQEGGITFPPPRLESKFRVTASNCLVIITLTLLSPNLDECQNRMKHG